MCKNSQLKDKIMYLINHVYIIILAPSGLLPTNNIIWVFWGDFTLHSSVILLRFKNYFLQFVLRLGTLPGLVQKQFFVVINHMYIAVK